MHLLLRSTRNSKNLEYLKSNPMIPGQRILKFSCNPSRIRERAFLVLIVSCATTILLNGFGFYYQFLYSDNHWITSILTFITFFSVELLLRMELLTSCLSTYCTIYVCYYSMQFWLRKIWYFVFDYIDIIYIIHVYDK